MDQLFILTSIYSLLHACTFPDNTPSIALLKKFKFLPQGTEYRYGQLVNVFTLSTTYEVPNNSAELQI